MIVLEVVVGVFFLCVGGVGGGSFAGGCGGGMQRRVEGDARAKVCIRMDLIERRAIECRWRQRVSGFIKSKTPRTLLWRKKNPFFSFLDKSCFLFVTYTFI